MKAVVEAARLQDALKLASAVIRRGNYQSSLLEVGDGKFAITATNGSQTIRATIPAEGSGDLAVDYDLFKRTINLAPPAATLMIEAAGPVIKIMWAGSHYEIGFTESDAFPDFPDFEGQSFALPKQDALLALAATAPWTEESMERAYLAGMWVVGENPDTLRFVSTNGKALAELTLPRPEGCNISSNYLVPTAALPTIQSIASGGDITVCLNDRRLSVERGGLKFTTQLVNADLPDYAQVIPDEGGTRVIFARGEFQRALEGAAFGCTPRDPAVLLSVWSGTATLAAAGNGSMVASTELEANSDGDAEVGLNSTHLATFLSSLKGPPEQTLTFWISTPGEVVRLGLGNMDNLRLCVMPRLVHKVRLGQAA